jgi:hypothetical protein
VIAAGVERTSPFANQIVNGGVRGILIQNFAFFQNSCKIVLTNGKMCAMIIELEKIQ